jgi:ligand-binding SRPBCC domain-containing protein
MLAQSSLEDTFAVFENPYNLCKITPPSLGFNVTSAQRVEMRKGAEIDYTIRWYGFPLHWKTLILEYEPPFCFVDQQLSGPYAFWRHRHGFEQATEGTKITDRVDYVLPLGRLGQFAHALAVRRQLISIFNYRQQELGKLLGGNTRQTRAPSVTVGNP